MMTTLQRLYDRMIAAIGVSGLEIPTTGVKFYKIGEDIPQAAWNNHFTSVSLTSCQATRQASLGDAVLLTAANIGCVAAAISLGLVDAHQATPLGGSRVYTDLMQNQAGTGSNFAPPTPMDFTEGIVYACRAAHRPEFGLFGQDDSGRYKDVNTAQRPLPICWRFSPR